MSLSVELPIEEPQTGKMSKQELELRNLTKTFTGIEKPLKNVPSVQSLSELMDELNRVFEQDHVNIEYVNHLMLSYKSNPAEWKKFAKFDRFRYTRNLIDNGTSGKFNLMVLCWGPEHGSAIHDHADSHCFMKMLSGQLSEVRYAWPKQKIIDDEEDGPQELLEEISRSTMEQDEVCYINGEQSHSVLDLRLFYFIIK